MYPAKRGDKTVTLLLLIGFSFGSGCADSSSASSASVSGKVTLAGTPVTAGSVLFMTDSGSAATAEISPNGDYQAHCTPGKYKVSVAPPPAPDPLAASPGAQAVSSAPPIPKRYQDLGTSGLSVELKAGENKFDIALNR